MERDAAGVDCPPHGLRNDDRRPGGIERLRPPVIWSFVCEVWLPQAAVIDDVSTADLFDYFWYICGALAASLFCDWWYQRRAICKPQVPDFPGGSGDS